MNYGTIYPARFKLESATFLIPDHGESNYDLWAPFAIGDTGQTKEILLQVIGQLKPGIGINGARRPAIKKWPSGAPWAPAGAASYGNFLRRVCCWACWAEPPG